MVLLIAALVVLVAVPVLMALEVEGRRRITRARTARAWVRQAEEDLGLDPWPFEHPEREPWPVGHPEREPVPPAWREPYLSGGSHGPRQQGAHSYGLCCGNMQRPHGGSARDISRRTY